MQKEAPLNAVLKNDNGNALKINIIWCKKISPFKLICKVLSYELNAKINQIDQSDETQKITVG